MGHTVNKKVLSHSLQRIGYCFTLLAFKYQLEHICNIETTYTAFEQN